MDKSETYIKMMTGAWPYLKDGIPVNSLLFSRRLRMLYILDGKLVMWSEKVNTSNYERAIPLLEQDQLQEMVNKNYEFDWELAEVFGKQAFGLLSANSSMERLWLAFVMEEKYNKAWNGEEWK